VIPKDPTRKVEADRDALLQALQRTAILSHEKFRGVRLSLKPGLFVVQANNTDQEEAEDQVEIEYDGAELEIGFNSAFLLDALSAIDSEKVQIDLTDSNTSCLIHTPGVTHTKYVVMPMRM
jgi:DNA polymerase-3 subunit beta